MYLYSNDGSTSSTHYNWGTYICTATYCDYFSINTCGQCTYSPATTSYPFTCQDRCGQGYSGQCTFCEDQTSVGFFGSCVTCDDGVTSAICNVCTDGTTVSNSNPCELCEDGSTSQHCAQEAIQTCTDGTFSLPGVLCPVCTSGKTSANCKQCDDGTTTDQVRREGKTCIEVLFIFILCSLVYVYYVIMYVCMYDVWIYKYVFVYAPCNCYVIDLPLLYMWSD